MRYLIMATLALALTACGQQTTSEITPAANDAAKDASKDKEKTVTAASYELKITDMTCTKCQARVKEKLESIDGVASAEVDWEKSYAKVTMKPGATLEQTTVDALIGNDYPVESCKRIEQ